MMRIVRGVMRALRPRNLLAMIGLLVLVHFIVNQALLFKVGRLEEEEGRNDTLAIRSHPDSSDNAAALYRYAYWLNGQIGGELEKTHPEIECPGASYYSCALDGRPCGKKDSPQLSTEQLELYGNVLSAKQPVYDLIARAATMPACMFTNSVSPEFWRDMEIDGNIELREMARLVEDKARWDARHGNLAGAWEMGRQGMVLVKHGEENSSILCRLNQLSLLQMVASAMVDIADQGPVPESVAGEYFAPLRSVSNSRAALVSAQRELAFNVQGIDIGVAAVPWGYWIQPVANWEKLRAFRAYGRLKEALSLGKPTERMAAVQQLVDTCPPAAALPPVLCPWRPTPPGPFNLAWFTYDLPGLFLLHQRMLETGIALKQYKQRQGSYPQELGLLAKDLPADTTIDPVTGKPFEYRLEGAGFVLKSPGPKAVGGDNRSGLNQPDILWQAKN